VSVCVEIKGDYIEKTQSCFISVTLKSLSGRKLLGPPTYVHIYMYIRNTVICKTVRCITVLLVCAQIRR
jgi:hypothetical protein